MKNPKRPTRSQKILMVEAGLDPLNWLTVRDTEVQLIVYSKVTGEVKSIEKQKKEVRRK